MASTNKPPELEAQDLIRDYRKKHAEATDPIKVLQLEEFWTNSDGSTPDEKEQEKKIKSAYRGLSRIYHPDKQKKSDNPAKVAEAAEKFIQINDAYNLLLNKFARTILKNEKDKKERIQARRDGVMSGRNKFAADLEAREQDFEARKGRNVGTDLGGGSSSSTSAQQPDSGSQQYESSGKPYQYTNVKELLTQKGNRMADELIRIQSENRKLMMKMEDERREYAHTVLDTAVKKERKRRRDARVIIQIKTEKILGSDFVKNIGELTADLDEMNFANKRLVKQIQADFFKLEREKKIQGFEGAVTVYSNANELRNPGLMAVINAAKRDLGETGSTASTTADDEKKKKKKDPNAIIYTAEIQFSDRSDANSCVEFLGNYRLQNPKHYWPWMGKSATVIEQSAPLRQDEIAGAKRRQRLFPKKGEFMTSDAYQRDNFDPNSAGPPRFRDLETMEKEILGRLEKMIHSSGA